MRADCGGTKQKRQHDTILKGLVQELDTFEKQMHNQMHSLETKLNTINDEVVFYNRVYLFMVMVVLLLVIMITQAARVRRNLPLLFERPRHRDALSSQTRRQSDKHASRQSQEDLSSLENLTVEDGPEDDADVLTLTDHVMRKRFLLSFSL